MSFDRARVVADAILFEGYALYPYRPSSRKNALRWQFGVLAPRKYSEDDGGESWWMETQCLIEYTGPGRLTGQLRFLRLRRRRVLPPEPVRSLDADGRLHVAWDEGDVHEIDFVRELGDEGDTCFELGGDVDEERITDGSAAGEVRVERRRLPLKGCIRVGFEPVPTPQKCLRVRLRVENHTSWSGDGSREEAMASSLLGTHLLLSIAGGKFVSLFDPPEWATHAAAACRNVRAFPVLAGEHGRRDVALASPVILYDYPQLAPESPGDSFDGTEIDEVLTLRARSLDRPPVASRRTGFDKKAGPAGQSFMPGDRVRLRPRARAHAQDVFLNGRIATVRSVLHDLEGRTCLAVTLDDNPGADPYAAHGRFHYLYADEVERMEPLTSP